MNALIIVVAVVILVMVVMLIEMLRVPAGIEREHHIKQRKIFSRTKTVTDTSIDEAVRLLQTDWSWWKKARAEKMKDLGGGRKEFLFHPVRYFNLIEVPPAFLVRFERTERLPDAGVRIHATLSGDFDGRAEYTVRPASGGTMVELAWCGAEVRSALRLAPITLVAAIHCWRERLGVQGLRERLKSRRSGG
jgi:hypothetical protein